jgi:hypothetical protein
MTDETTPKRPANPRSEARPSLRSRGVPVSSRTLRGTGAGAISLVDGSWRQRQLLMKQGVAKRSTAYLTTKELIAAIESDLGGSDQLSAAERQLVQHAAIVGSMLADMEIRYLAGKTIDTSEYGFLVGVQHRLFSLIGLRRRPKDVTPSLEDVLRDEPK